MKKKQKGVFFMKHHVYAEITTTSALFQFH